MYVFPYVFVHVCVCMCVCMCVSSVPDGPVLLRLLSDAETDDQDGAVLQHVPERAGEGPGENSERPQQHPR